MKNTLVIVYNGGTYGTYLEWALNTLMSSMPVVSPLTRSGAQIGNSHQSVLGKQLLNMSEWRQYVNSSQEYPTIRLHPKTLAHESLKDNLEEVAEDCSNILLIYPDREHELLCINNYMSKIWDTSSPYQGPMKDIDLDLVYKNFPVPTGTAVQDIPRWIVREHLSYCLVPSWRSQVEWFFPDHWQNPKCHIVFVDQLLYNFESVLEYIATNCDTNFKQPTSVLKNIHQDMLQLQVHAGQDQLCKNIVDSVILKNKNLQWGPLSLASESWIQWKLRELGFELRCDQLNCFPTNTLDLKKLTYKINQ